MTKMFTSGKAVLCLVIVLVLGPFAVIPSHAQVTGATISGTVTDPSGDAIPKARVSVKNTATGVTTDATTDADGFYTVPNLLPGVYDVTVTAPGFATLAEKAITLEVGAKQALPISMKVGQTTQTIEVSGAAPTVDLTTSAISGEVTSTTVRELPLNGRDWTQLATLQPGVTVVQDQAATGAPTVSRGNRGFGNQMTDSGHSPYQNNYRMNGISINDYTNGAPGSPLGINLGVDAIQEFSVLTTDYTAEYGKTSGMVINAITKSGTNEFHGDGFYFLRSNDLDARGLNAPATNPPFHRDQYGGSFGGPIVKNKTFFFVAYEGINNDESFSNVNEVPTAAVRSGIDCSILDIARCQASGTINYATLPSNAAYFAKVQPYFALWPQPNGPYVVGTGGDIATYYSTGLLHVTENYVTARADHHISAADSLAASFFYDKSPQIQPDPLNNVTTTLLSERWLGEIEETHVFSPSLINSARFGFSRVVGLSNDAGTALTPIGGDTSLGSLPGRPAPILKVSGLQSTATLGSSTTDNHILNSFQFYDDAFLTKGKHSLKFGFALEHQQGDEHKFQALNGQFGFGSIPNFLQDIPANFRIFDPSTSFESAIRATAFGLYAQDDWRVSSNLTLNLGLRWEPISRPTDANNRIELLLHLTDPTLTPEHSPMTSNPYLHAFEPRIGFAWDPFRDGKTSVRAGFGIFDQLPLTWLWELALDSVYPYNLQISALPASTNGNQGFFPTGGGIPAQPIIPPTLAGAIAAASVKSVAPPKISMSMDWNLNIQRALTPSTSFTIAYVGSRSIHMPNNIDETNVVFPSSVTMDGVSRLIWPTPIGSGTTINPNFGDIHYVPWDDNGFYDALQVGVKKNLSQGFQVQGSYTYSRCIDYGSNMNIGDPFNNSIASLFFFANLQQRRGLCDYDINQAFSANYLWNIPKPAWASGFAAQALGGWSIGGIITAQTGTPFTVGLNGDPLGEMGSEQWDFADRLRTPQCTHPTTGNPTNYLDLSCFTPPTAPASFAAQCAPFTGAGSPAPSGRVYCANLLGDTGRNSVYGPGFTNVDFSVMKNFPITRISEQFNIQFRAEFFNILNHLNYLPPDDLGGSTMLLLYNQDGSVAYPKVYLDQQAGNSRQIQFGLKLIF
jgi:hypothetical protein